MGYCVRQQNTVNPAQQALPPGARPVWPPKPPAAAAALANVRHDRCRFSVRQRFLSVLIHSAPLLAIRDIDSDSLCRANTAAILRFNRSTRNSPDTAGGAQMHAIRILAVPACLLLVIAGQGCNADDEIAKRDAAIAELERLRVLVYRDDEHGGMRADGAFSAVRDDDLSLFQQIPDLRILDLRGSSVSDEGLKHLSGLTSLRELNLDHTKIVGGGLVRLKELSSLIGLYLTHTNVSDADIVPLDGLRNLRRLNLCNTRVTDNLLPIIQGMDSLDYVGAMFTRVTEAAANRHEDATSTEVYAGNDSPLHPGDELVLPGHPVWNFNSDQATRVALDRLNADAAASPESAAPLVRRSRHFAYVGQTAEALTDLNRALELDPKCVDALFQRARLLRYDNKLAEARQDLELAIQLAPDDARLYLERGYVLSDPLAMEADFAKSIALSPTNATAWLDRGLVYARENNLNEAQKCFDEAVRLAPLSTKILRNRAILHENTGNYAAAISDLNDALRIEPTFVIALLQLATLLTECPDESLRDAERAQSLAFDACQLTDYTNAYSLSSVAAAFAEQGDFAEAVKYQQQAIECIQDAEESRTSYEEELELYRQRKKPWDQSDERR
jgi:tetratricopeptide (TPR) repeat protein